MYIIENNKNKEFNLTKDEILILLLEMKENNGKNIFIRSVKNRLNFNNEELVQKILNTEKGKIIDCVHNYINQIK